MGREFSQVQTPEGFRSRCDDHDGNLNESGGELRCELPLLSGGKDVYVMDNNGTVTLERHR